MEVIVFVFAHKPNREYIAENKNSLNMLFALTSNKRDL